MALAKRILRALPLLLLSPFLMVIAMLALAVTDLWWRVRGAPRHTESARVNRTAASVVIPNWNGVDLLAQYLPSVVEAMEGNPANEIIVVDNGSSDGSAEFVRENFPTV